MNRDLSDDNGTAEVLQEFRAALREFLHDSVAPLVQDGESRGEVPWEVVQQLGQLGYLSIGLPTDLGGGLAKEGDFVLVEELARVWGALAMTVMSSVLIAPRLCLESESEELWERWGEAASRGASCAAFAVTEEQAGSDALGITSVAVPEDSGWRITGRKAYVAGGKRAEFMIVAAKVGSRDATEIGLFAVGGSPPPWEVSTTYDMDCHRALDVVELTFEDVPVPSFGRVDGNGQGQIWQSLAGERILSAALAVGLAQGALDLALDYAKERHQFGRAIGTFGEIFRMLADSESEVSAARALGIEAARAWDRGDRSALGPSRAKLFASEMAVRVTERAQHIHGGYGQMSEFHVGRYARDARMGPVGGGVSEVQARIIARELGIRMPPVAKSA